METVNGRIPPALPAGAFKTYQIASPLRTHWRRATCAEVECDAYLHGWTSLIDESTELGQRIAHYIRGSECGRRFTEERQPHGLTAFHFEAGQQGFASQAAAEDHARHVIRLDREPRYIERGGDWRANPSGFRREHTRPELWVESFAENQGRLAALAERG